MRIVHAVYSLEMGGVEILVAQLCRVHRAQGHEVTVCAYANLGVVGEMLRAEGFRVEVIGESHPGITMLRYLRLFRRLRPDVVHCHNRAATIHASLAGRLAGARSVLATRHDLVAPYDRVAEMKFSIASLCCDWIAGVCESTCENLRRAPFAHRGKVMRVYNGTTAIDPCVDRSGDAGPGKRGFTLVYVGRLAEVKDLETMLRAMAIAAETMPALQLWIVGDGPMRDALEELAGELGIYDLVRFWGQQLNTAPFFSAADAFAMSSISEGLPISLLQAMSMGLPAIVTDVGGMAEAVRLSGGGLLTPVGDPDRMAETILRLAGDPALREELSRLALESYSGDFTLEQMASGYMEIYRHERQAVSSASLVEFPQGGTL